MHEVDNQNGLLANCRFKQSSKSGMDYKITQLQAELHTGINPSSLEPCPIMTRRSVILCYGNHHFAPMTGTFVGKVLSTLSEYTHFKCAQILTPHELDDYCARFHGISSILFAGEALYNFVEPVPFTDDDGNAVPLIKCKDDEITRQFIALNYRMLTDMMEFIEDPPALAKKLNKFILELRHKTPSHCVAQVVFGNVHGCKEFAWMFPYIRATIDNYIVKYRNKLIATL